MPRTLPFWRRKRLEQMSPAEWESLCDDCGKCCLYRREDEAAGTREKTNVACKMLNCASGTCSHYQKRKNMAPDINQLTPPKGRQRNVRQDRGSAREEMK